MKLLTRISLLFLLLAALLPSTHAYTATGNLPIQVEPSGSTWDTVTADATAQSSGAASGGTPIYHSTKLEETPLEGDFTADSSTTNLALFSDDGCDVTIDGTKVWSDRDKGHALENLSASLHKLTITLKPGQKYHIKIDYSNIQYDGNGDIDGVTLFTWNDAPPQVTLTADDPGDPDDFQQVTSEVYAKVDHLPGGHFAADLTATWTWSVVSVTHSDTVDGSYTTDGVDASLFSVIGDNSDLTSPTAAFNGEFDLDGLYEVKVRATVKYHDRRTGEDLGPYTSADTGDVYLGDTDDELSNDTALAGSGTNSGSGNTNTYLRPNASAPPTVNKVHNLGIKWDIWGKYILRRWYEGTGKEWDLHEGDRVMDPVTYEMSTPIDDYLEANYGLQADLSVYLRDMAKNIPLGGKLNVNAQTHCELSYGYSGYFEDLTGYTLLHGSKDYVGDVSVIGVIVHNSDNSYYASMTYRWNDVIDPKKENEADTILSKAAKYFKEFTTLGAYPPADYVIRINFASNAKFYIGVPPIGQKNSGFPFSYTP